jgi:hypothetical protein
MENDPEGGFAPLPAVVARLTACSFLPPPRKRIARAKPALGAGGGREECAGTARDDRRKGDEVPLRVTLH